MSFEKPPQAPNQESPEQKEHEHQDTKEEQNTAFFFQTEVANHPGLTDAQKSVIKEHIESQPGQWREIDGKDVTVVDFRIEPTRIVFTISLYGMDVDDEIPLT